MTTTINSASSLNGLTPHSDPLGHTALTLKSVMQSATALDHATPHDQTEANGSSARHLNSPSLQGEEMPEPDDADEHDYDSHEVPRLKASKKKAWADTAHSGATLLQGRLVVGLGPWGLLTYALRLKKKPRVKRKKGVPG